MYIRTINVHVCTLAIRGKLTWSVETTTRSVCRRAAGASDGVLYLQFAGAAGSVHSMPLPPDLSLYIPVVCETDSKYAGKCYMEPISAVRTLN